MQNLLDQTFRTIGTSLPSLIFAILILLIGWLIAMGVAAAVRALLKRTEFDNRFIERLGFKREDAPFPIEEVAARTVFWVIMVFVLVAFFQALGLTIITNPLNALLVDVFEYLPNLLGAGILFALAWLLATALRLLISTALGATQLDDNLSRQAGLDEGQSLPMSETIANVVYWLIFLLFLPAILGALNLSGLLDPVMGMLNEVLAYLPNVLAAALILLLGWFIARIIRQVVTNLLAAAGADALAERVGLATVMGEQKLSGLLGALVYVLILIPVIISALTTLDIEAISAPAIMMLTTILNAIPLVFGAAIILTVTYFIARLVADLVTNLLQNFGFDRILTQIGLAQAETPGNRTPSEIVGFLVLFALMVFAATEAANLLGFGILATLLGEFLVFFGKVVLAVIVFGFGLFLANLVRNIVRGTAASYANLLGNVAWAGIVVLTTSMALRQMDIAEDIINLAFGLLLGAVAVAAALAFGLGSRDIAREEVQRLLSNVRESPESGE